MLRQSCRALLHTPIRLRVLQDPWYACSNATVKAWVAVRPARDMTASAYSARQRTSPLRVLLGLGARDVEERNHV